MTIKNYNIFKAKVYVLNDITDNSFEKIFCCRFAALVDKLIHTTSKEENQIIFDDIENNSRNIYEEYRFDDVKIIPEINKVLTSDKVNND